MKSEKICEIICGNDVCPHLIRCSCNKLYYSELVIQHYETVIIPARIAEEQQRVIKLLDEVHDLLDAHNSLYATENKYCLYCHSKSYDSANGIVHTSGCIITKLRQQLKSKYGVKK